jgi:hypothetical protein
MDRILNNDNSREDDSKGSAYHSESVSQDFSFEPPPLQLKIDQEIDTGEKELVSQSFQHKERTGAGDLPPNLQSGVEALSGYSLNDVNVHYNSSKPHQLSANAYAQGKDIHIAPGQEKHLPHEAWHVVQQKQGRVDATYQANSGVGINDDPSLEQEADQMGAKALQMKASLEGGRSTNDSKTIHSANAIQLSVKDEIVTFANKLGIAKTIDAIASHFGIDKKVAHEILSRGDSYEAKLAALNNEGNKIKAASHEAESKTKAEEMEVDDASRTAGGGGHAIARHGPNISDAALQKRLYSGMAPDNALSPAPGSSSKFKTYAAMIQTRQAAASALKSEIVSAQSKVLKWKMNAIGKGKLKEIDDSMIANEASKQSAFDKANASHTKLMSDLAADRSLGPKVPESLSNKINSEQKLDAAKKQAITSAEEVVTPGKNLLRLWPSHSKLDLDIKEAANEGTLEDNVKLTESYTIVVKHSEAIGEGFKSDDAISLTDVTKQAALNPDADKAIAFIPKSIVNIKAALVALSVGGNIDEFATYLSDAGNLEKARKKGSKGGKIYKATQAAGDLHKTSTNLKVEGDKKLFSSDLGSKDDKPVKIDTANWPAFQHFPAAEDVEEGVK